MDGMTDLPLRWIHAAIPPRPGMIATKRGQLEATSSSEGLESAKTPTFQIRNCQQ